MILEYTEKQICDAAQLVKQYFGLEVSPTDARPIILEEEFVQDIRDAYERLGSCDNDEQILLTFLLLASGAQRSPNFLGVNPMVNRHSILVRRDLLQLLLLSETTKDGDALIVKNRSRSFRLGNNANWIIREIIAPYLECHLGQRVTREQAKRELEAGESHRRGRRVSDPRVPILMMGTWRLLTDMHGFRTPMPNILCGFIIRLLQMLGIFPENTDIDTLWVRAQLRYLKNREIKQNQESSSGS